MNHRRSATLISVGIVAGSGLTALLFYFFLIPASPSKLDEDEEPVIETDSVVSEDSDQVDPEVESVPAVPDERYLSGDCVLSGKVLDQDGMPLAGALVSLRLLDDSWSTAPVGIETRTNDLGQFKMENLSRAYRYQLWAWSPEYVATSHVGARCGTHTDLVLGPGATLRLAFMGPDNEPLSNVEIQIMGSALWPGRIGKSDKEGKLVVAGLSPGDYSIWAFTQKLAYLSSSPISIDSNTNDEKQIVLSTTRPSLVTVTSGDTGKPIGGASIRLNPTDSPLLGRTLTTDDQGRISVKGLLASAFSISAKAPGFIESDPVLLEPGNELRLKVERGARVSGIVRTSDGDPVKGAILVVDREMGRSLTEVPSVRGKNFNRRLITESGKGLPRLYTRDDGISLPGPLHIPLARRSSHPVAILPPSNGNTWAPTDSSGMFQLDGLPSGFVTVRAEHPDFVIQSAAQVTLQPGAATAGLSVVMRKGSTLKIRILDEREYPIRNVDVTIYDKNDSSIAAGISGTDGFASFDGLPGSFRVEALAEGRVPGTVDYSGKTGETSEIEIKLPLADQVLHGRVVDERGFGIGNATIIAKTVARRITQVLSMVTAEDGTFALEGAGAVSYHIIAESEEHGRAQINGVDSSQEIKIVIGGPGTIKENNDFVTPQMLESIQGSNNLNTQAFGEDLSENIDSLNNASLLNNREVPTPITITTTSEETDDDPYRLPVTGPPSGKGGLPIKLAGTGGNVVVSKITPGSRVAGAGLSVGDRIIAIDKRKVSSVADARRALGGAIGSVVMLDVTSSGERFTIVVQRTRVR